MFGCVCGGGGGGGGGVGGQGLFAFALYIIENFILSLDRHLWTNFNIIYQKCSFGDPLPRSHHDSSKYMAAWGRSWGCGGGGGGGGERGGDRAYFPYIFINKTKNLVKNHWTDFNMILLCLSIKIVQAIMICQKTWPPDAVLFFPLSLS